MQEVGYIKQQLLFDDNGKIHKSQVISLKCFQKIAKIWEQQHLAA